METKVRKERKVYPLEIIWYSFFGLVWVTGLVLAILGVCAWNVGRLSDNPLYAAQKGLAAAFGGKGIADFRIVGTCFMLVAMVGFLIALYYYATKISQKEAEKRRYEERMRILMAGESTAKPSSDKPAETTPTASK
jgi:flagellar biogenesis protein FliO